MAENVQITIRKEDGNTVKITDSKVCAKITTLFTTGYISDGMALTVEDKTLLAKLTSGKSLIVIHRWDDEDREKDETTEFSKTQVAKYVENIHAMFALAKANNAMKKITGSYGKRGKTATEVSYDGVDA
jgi:hypothetical protein